MECSVKKQALLCACVLVTVLVLTGCGNPWIRDITDPLFKKDSSSTWGNSTRTWNNEDFGPGVNPDYVFNVSNDAQLSQAIDAITHYPEGTPAAWKNYIINLNADVGKPGSTGPTFWDISSNARYIRVSIRGNHHINLDSAGSLFAVNSHQRLIIRGAELWGQAPNTGTLVTVALDAELVLRDGAILNNSANSSGGGVYTQGRFIMYGGRISGNTANNVYGGGGGVCVEASGSFEMYGGTISGNHVNSGNGAGVYVATYGNCTMHGGSITGNTAVGKNGAGLYVDILGQFYLVPNTAVSRITGNTGYMPPDAFNNGASVFDANGGNSW